MRRKGEEGVYIDALSPESVALIVVVENESPLGMREGELKRQRGVAEMRADESVRALGGLGGTEAAEQRQAVREADLELEERVVTEHGRLVACIAQALRLQPLGGFGLLQQRGPQDPQLGRSQFKVIVSQRCLLLLLIFFFFFFVLLRL